MEFLGGKNEKKKAMLRREWLAKNLFNIGRDLIQTQILNRL